MCSYLAIRIDVRRESDLAEPQAFIAEGAAWTPYYKHRERKTWVLEVSA